MGHESSSLKICINIDLYAMFGMDEQNAHHNARGGAEKHSTTRRACFSVRSAVGNACACLLGIMATKLCALATTTGRPRKEDPSVLELQLRRSYNTYQYSL